jgi:hypothetical protein
VPGMSRSQHGRRLIITLNEAFDEALTLWAANAALPDI